MKVYDRVEWVFLEEMMLKMGFSPVWVSMVMRCARSVRFQSNLMVVFQTPFDPPGGYIRETPPFSISIPFLR
jgi:hypothetical protein